MHNGGGSEELQSPKGADHTEAPRCQKYGCARPCWRGEADTWAIMCEFHLQEPLRCAPHLRAPYPVGDRILPHAHASPCTLHPPPLTLHPQCECKCQCACASVRLRVRSTYHMVALASNAADPSPLTLLLALTLTLTLTHALTLTIS